MQHAGFLTNTVFAVLVAAALPAWAADSDKTAYDDLTWPVTEEEFNASLPDDVYPDSRSRIPLIKREDLDDERKLAYDERIAPDTTSLAGLQGPGGLRLSGSPSLSETLVDARTLELVRLVVSREMNHPFEWTLHEPVALKAGLEPDIIDIIRYRRTLDGLPDREAAIIQWGREVFQNYSLSSETFARLRQHFSIRDMMDMSQFMGNYARTAIMLHTFDAHLPYDREPLLPLP
jgi:4-carboxymuconolactone decarboxylase